MMWAVLAFGAGLRLWGVQHDLPHSYYPDELHFVQRAVSFGSGDLNPHWFHKPALYMYLLFVEYGLYYCAGFLIGSWQSVSEFAVSFVESAGAFILIGRLTTVLFSLASLVAVYRIGEKHFGRHVGLVAALLLSLVVGHVEPSRWVKADVPAAFFAIASAYFLLNYLRDGRWKAINLAAALAAMGSATKYYPVVMLLPISVAAVCGRGAGQGRWPHRGAQLLCAGVVYCAVFLVCSPFNLLDARGRQQTLGSFGVGARLERLVSNQPTTGPDAHINERMSLLEGASDYVGVLVSERGMGGVIAVICMTGFCIMLARRDRDMCVFAIYPVVFAFVSIVVYPGYAGPRHQCTIYPFLAVIGGAALVWCADLQPRFNRLVYATLGVALCVPLASNLKLSASILKTDARTVAKRWIEAEIPDGTRLLVSEHGPELRVCKKRIDQMLERSLQADADGQFTAHYADYLRLQSVAAERGVSYDCDVIRVPWWRDSFTGEVETLDSEYDKDMGNPLKPVGVFGYHHYVDQNYQFAIVHSNQYEDFVGRDAKAASNFPAFHRFYSDLFSHGTLVKEFSPATCDCKGPVVRVYRLTPTSDSCLQSRLSAATP